MTGTDVIEMTRQELYERVWNTPMRTLAGEWGLSDVGLAKICEKHKIPRPLQGHWSKKRHGKTVRRTPLPAIDGDQLNTITISPVDRVDGPSIADSEIARLIVQESQPDRAIVVGEHTQVRHPFVRATRESLKGMRPNDYGRMRPNRQYPHTHFDVQVSPQNVSRALRILQGLTSAMEARGYRLKAGHNSRHPYFDVMGKAFEVAMRESSKQFKRKHDDSHRDGWTSKRYDYVPTGMLELCINYRSYSSDATLRDTQRKRLESRLNQAIIAMLRRVDRSRREAELARIEAMRKAERKKIAVEEEIERRSDSARIERLKHLTQQWETHRRFSAFVDAVRSEADARATEIDPDTIDWLTWADAFLREIDPLCGGEDLPMYSLSEDERAKLRCECETDWSEWSETFRSIVRGP